VQGGEINSGTVFRLSHIMSGWVEGVLYRFHAPGDGQGPATGVISDAAKNLYGTAQSGGNSFGTVYEVMPFVSNRNKQSG
jgi:hypothetical protein